MFDQFDNALLFAISTVETQVKLRLLLKNGEALNRSFRLEIFRIQFFHVILIVYHDLHHDCVYICLFLQKLVRIGVLFTLVRQGPSHFWFAWQLSMVKMAGVVKIGRCGSSRKYQFLTQTVCLHFMEYLFCVLFCLRIMRRSNCSAPIPPRQPRGQRKYACDKKGRGTRKKGDFGDYIGRGK